MAKEPEKKETVSLPAIDAAIASLRAQGWDLNPYAVAAAAELGPEEVFHSSAAMDKIMEARGDGSTYSYDAELGSRCRELTAELDNATVINQDLYDRGSELAERVVELEANIAELEQEAETLALQLQNSWSIGYQKGLVEGREKAEAAAKSNPQIQTGEHPAVRSVQTIGSITEDELPVEALRQSSLAEEVEVAPAVVSTPVSKTAAEPEAKPVAKPAAEPIKEPVKVAAEKSDKIYNEQVFNAVSDHRPAVNVSEVYGALSWKQIETVYQYSTVAGKPNTNLYFEPLDAGEPDQSEAEPVAESLTKPELIAKPAVPEAAFAPEIPLSQEPVASEPAVIQPAVIEPVVPEAPKPRSKRMPDISFDPPDEPIVGIDAKLAPKADLGKIDLGKVEKPLRIADGGEQDFVNQYDGGLTGENFPSLISMQAASNGKKGRPASNNTFERLDALPAQDDEVPDILDLDKLDIFEGMEDIDDLSSIEVIEDVILSAPPQDPNVISQSETAAMPKVSGEDLRDLIKTRIKQAQDHDPNQQHPLDQLVDAANSTTPAPAEPVPTASAEVQSAETKSTTEEIHNLDIEALRHGGRNKFVGGKTPPAAAGGVTGEATVPMPNLGGAAAGASGGPAPRVAPVPPDIRKHCMILGVRPEELTVKLIIEAWKAQIAAPGVHPDQGGDTETAVYLNLAKDTLVKYVEAQAPKLGKKFGQPSQTRDSQSKPFTMRQGPDKDTDKK